MKSETTTLFKPIKTHQDWKNLLDSSKGLVVADIYKTWSGPCVTLNLALETAKSDFDEEIIKFISVSTESCQIPDLQKTSCEPTIAFFVSYFGFKNNTLIDSINGIKVREIIQKIKTIYKRIQNKEFEESENTDSQQQIATESSTIGEIKDSGTNLEPLKEETSLIIIKPDIVSSGKSDMIIDKLKENQVEIIDRIEKILTRKEVEKLYVHHKDKEFFPDLVDYITSGPVLAVIIKAGDVENLKEVVGPSDINEARERAPSSFRAIFGTDQIRNGVHCSSDAASAEQEIALFFSDSTETTIIQTNKMRTSFKKAIIGLDPLKLKDENNDEMQIERLIGSINNNSTNGLFFGIFKEMNKENLEVLDIFDKIPNVESELNNMIQNFKRNSIIENSWSMNIIEVISKQDTLEKELIVDLLDGIKQNLSESLVLFHKDSIAKELLENIFGAEEKTLAMIKPELFEKRFEILERIEKSGLFIENIKERILKENECILIYPKNSSEAYFNDLVEHIVSGPSILMVLSGFDAVKRWKNLIGPVDPNKAKYEKPDSIRALLGIDIMKNGVHGASEKLDELDKIQELFDD
ncbi:MAG: Thioredoxin domain-containing protein 3 [Paramarteilia canceri]